VGPTSSNFPEEFVGPFVTWINAQTGTLVGGGGSLCTGSTGNGSTDDTTAFQSCLTAIGPSNPCLWVPAGNYKITHTLNLSAQQYVCVVGADPSTTTITWAGTNASPFAGTHGTASGTTTFSDSTANGFVSGVVGNYIAIFSGSGFTPGTYFITGFTNSSTITLDRSPGTGTAASWSMAAPSTMLYLNGTAFSQFNRITFNGASSAGILVDQSKAASAGNYADVGNQYADDVFGNSTASAFKCGVLGFQCSETTMLRDKYLNNATNGITLDNPNALNMWVWYSLFQNNGSAITYKPLTGSFNAYNNVFLNNTVADVSNGNTGVMTFRGNYSSGSAFFLNSGGTGAPDNITLQGNTILDTTNALSAFLNDPGPLVAIDNIIRTSLSAASVSYGSGTATAASGPVMLSQSDLFSYGNTYTTGTSACTMTSPTYSPGHCHGITDQIVLRGSVNPPVPTLPPTPPNLGRTIFEASPSGSGTTCSAGSPCSVQQAITNAAAVGNNAVAHIQVGSYSISSPIVVPANTNIQIIGDGYYSHLTWTGASSGGPLLQLTGPSKAVVRDVKFTGGSSTTAGIEITNADQPGAQVFAQQATMAGSQTNLFFDALDHTRVEFDNTQHFSSPGTSVNVVGGTSAAGGTWLGGTLDMFAGVGFGNITSGYSVTSGGHSVANINFNDGGACSTTCLSLANVTGRATFTYAGGFLALNNAAPSTYVTVSGLNGNAAFLNNYSFGSYSTTGNGSLANVLGIGLVGQTTTFFGDTSSPAATLMFLNGQEDSGGSVSLAEVNCCSGPFLSATLSQIRTETPTLPNGTPSGVTDARLYHVFVENFTAGIHIH
jgi:hypothetical protein